MSDYELLTVVLMILGIIVSILIAYINHTKRNRKCRSRRRGLPRSPTIEIICFLPSGTKRLFFRSEKQKRLFAKETWPADF
mgnify:CR=1 FL=1